MSKEDFLLELERALLSELPKTEVDSNLVFYKEFIAGEMEKGKSEQEIIEALGNPRLIAKTIMETYAISSSNVKRNVNDYYNKSEYSDGAKEYYHRSEQGKKERKFWNVSYSSTGKTPWYSKVLTGLIIIAVIAALVAIGSILLWILFSVMIPIFIIILLFSLFKTWRK